MTRTSQPTSIAFCRQLTTCEPCFRIRADQCSRRGCPKFSEYQREIDRRSKSTSERLFWRIMSPPVGSSLLSDRFFVDYWRQLQTVFRLLFPLLGLPMDLCAGAPSSYLDLVTFSGTKVWPLVLASLAWIALFTQVYAVMYDQTAERKQVLNLKTKFAPFPIRYFLYSDPARRFGVS